MSATAPESSRSVAAGAAPGAGTQGDGLARARLYRFFELALSHPAEDGLAYFRDPATEAAYNDALAAASHGTGEAASRAREAGGRFFAALRALDDAQAESAHIALFSVNFPSLPCPPYGSLFTVEGDKRLDAMRQIKEFYQRNGFDIDDAFTDLPDHLCVELEFLQALCFREHEALFNDDPDLAADTRRAQSAFLDRHLLPFSGRIAGAARVQQTPNLYADLLEAADAFACMHRRALDVAVGIQH